MKAFQVTPVLLLTMYSVLAASDVATATAANKGSDWPCWQGPHMNGTSDEKRLLREWPASGPEVLWKVPIDRGWSTPVVSGDDVFVHMVKSVQWGVPSYEYVACFDAKTGAKKWENGENVKYSDDKKGWGCGWIAGGPRATPCVTEKYIYTLGALGLFSCRDRKTGELVWQLDQDKKYEHFNLNPKGDDWKGTLIAPLVVGKTLIMNVFMYRGRNSLAVGLDPETGKELWTYEVKSKVFDQRIGTGIGWPVALNSDPDTVYFMGNTSLVALNAADGKELFNEVITSHGWCGSIFPLAENKFFYASSGHNHLLLDINRGSKTAKTLWQIHCPECDYWNAVAVKNNIYTFLGKDVNPNAVDKSPMKLTCLDMDTGKVAWETKDEFYHGVSIAAADDLLFVRSFQTLWLVEARSDQYSLKGKVEKVHNISVEKVNAQNTLGWGDWVQPVLSRGKLYVRAPAELICFDVADHGKDKAAK